MYKAILIDDEPWALRGLVNSIKWEAYQIEVCYRSTDARQALTAILDIKPDIVITDIHMPKLSGLDLICAAREYGVVCKFIIFSGFSDFEYARQAIQYGVFAYLLKPLNKQEFHGTLKLLVKSLETERIEQDAFVWSTAPQARDFDLILGDRNCAVSCYMTDADRLLLDKSLKDLPSFSVKAGSDKHLYIFRETCAIVRNRLEEWLSQTVKKDREYIYCGISGDFGDVTELRSAVRDSEIAAQNHFVDPQQAVHTPVLPHPEKCKAFMQNFQTVFAKGAAQETELLLRELPAHCKRHNLNILDFCSIYNEILTLLTEEVKGQAGVDAEKLTYHSVTQQFFGGPPEAVDFLLSIYGESTSGGRGPKEKTSHSAADSMERILHYIKDNYNKELSLSLLSETFYLNMTYICDLFKKNLNTTFSKYLTDLRLQRAHILIRSTDQSLMDIAESVGYRDYYYFIKQFKKKYSVTPGQLKKEQ